MVNATPKQPGWSASRCSRLTPLPAFNRSGAARHRAGPLRPRGGLGVHVVALRAVRGDGAAAALPARPAGGQPRQRTAGEARCVQRIKPGVAWQFHPGWLVG